MPAPAGLEEAVRSRGRDFRQVDIEGELFCLLHMNKLRTSPTPVRIADSWALDVRMKRSLGE